LTKLSGLVKRGDAVAANDLGVIYLNSKISKIPRDLELSERYFRAGAQLCYKPSINLLKEVFYNRRGSGFFDPVKSEKIVKNCSYLQETVSSESLSKSNEMVVSQKSFPKINNTTETDKNTVIDKSVRQKWALNLPVYKIDKGSGSSVAISDEGGFLTNHHVIDECQNIAVLYNNMKTRGSVTAYNVNLDLALVKVDAPTPFYARIDNTVPLMGESLIALGYPIDFVFGDGPSYSSGELTNASDTETAVKREGFLLTSIPLASGNSGGPVFNQTGALRGIVSYGRDSRAMEEAMNKEGGKLKVSTTTLNFIVSSNRIVDWLESQDENFVKVESKETILPPHIITAQGEKSLGKIECY
jgi:S1-C subfamily serine protease